MDNKEKRLRKDSSTVGFFLFLMVVVEVVSFLFEERFIKRISFLSVHIDLIHKVTDILIYLLVPMFIFSILSILKGKNLKKIINLKIKKEKIWIYFFISFFVVELANVVTTIFMNLMKSTHITSSSPEFNYGDTALSIFLSVLGVSVVPAIAEEFVFRGVILNVFKPYGEKFAILASSLLFGLLHGNVEQFIFAFLLGLYFGYVAIKTKSILPTIIIHFFNNFLSGIYTLFKSNEEIRIILSMLNIFLAMVGLVFIVIFILKNVVNFRFKTFSVFKNDNGVGINFIDKINAFIFNPGMTLFMFETLVMFYLSIRVK